MRREAVALASVSVGMDFDPLAVAGVPSADSAAAFRTKVLAISQHFLS